MALEQVFKSPKTLDRLQRNPLGKFADGFCRWLLEYGFSRTTIRHHLFYLSHVNEHVETQFGIGQSINLIDLNAFLEGYSSQCLKTGVLDEHTRQLGYSVNRFLHYLRASRIVAPPTQKEIYRPLLDAYLEWMRRYQFASDGTIATRSHSITRFLQWLGTEATSERLSNLSAERIETFFLRYAQEMGRAARHSMQSALRTFLRFCLHQGYIDRSLDLAVPTLRTYRLATVPRGLSDNEAQRVLRQIDRSSHVGWRDYAIVQLLYTYGVRGGQVRALQLADIDWVHNQILFKASKHGKDSRLPLTIEAGESLLDYLQHSRPTSSFPHVFLTCRAPYHPFSSSGSLSSIIERHIRAAGIESPSNGAHTFRHSFATRMLSEGHSMKAIADVLGHRHLSTTFIYTKVEFNALKQVALEWPLEVSQ